MRKKQLTFPLLKKILLLFLVGFTIFAGVFIYGIITNKQPQFFPLDDAQAEYTITKNCPDAQGRREPKQNNLGNAYCLEYKGDNAMHIDEYYPNSKYFTVTIGKSDIDLATFIGKQVKNIQGEFVSSSKQCIKGNCVGIGGPFVVFDIDAIEGTQTDTKRAVELFTKGKVHDINFVAQYDNPTYGGYVDEYKDIYGATYQVDIKTNKIVYFLAYGIASYPKERKTIITSQQAEEIGLALARENIDNFENYTKDAEYSFAQETSSKMLTKYNFNWMTKKEDKDGNLRSFHTVIALDQYGNVIIFQNEFADRG